MEEGKKEMRAPAAGWSQAEKAATERGSHLPFLVTAFYCLELNGRKKKRVVAGAAGAAGAAGGGGAAAL